MQVGIFLHRQSAVPISNVSYHLSSGGPQKVAVSCYQLMCITLLQVTEVHSNGSGQSLLMYSWKAGFCFVLSGVFKIFFIGFVVKFELLIFLLNLGSYIGSA